MLDDRDARRALNCVVDGADLKLLAWLRRCSPAEAWAHLLRGSPSDPWTARARRFDLGAVLQKEQAAGLRFVTPEDDEWPDGFDLLDGVTREHLGGRPLGLWVAGRHRLDAALARSVAIVGSRASSPYGEQVATSFAAGLAQRGYSIVSGAAYGIDAAAHRGALAEGGLTVAFLAAGADQVYPRMNERLISQIRDEGLVVSEYPPGEHPTRPRFLARNRLIATGAGAVVLVEAAYRSGARNTATWARDCGRPVLAVPGPVGSALTETPHNMIRSQEAVLVATVDHIVEVLAPLGTVCELRPSYERLLDTLTDTQRSLYEALPRRGGKTPGELALRAGLSMTVALSALGALVEAGWAEQAAGGGWRKGPATDRPMLPSEQALPLRAEP